MASRVKEDEKNERIIRNLLKLPENRRCINCNSLGPQYVCTNFWTFVCTNCSGIHREFTHRVKSISMAKFTSQEVASLQGGGNARAKDVYLKELDSQGRSFPDSSNVEKVRDFIKHVYVDRRYTGEKSFDKPPRVKMNEPEDSYVNKKNDAYQTGSRSPSEDGYDRRYGDKPSPGGRNDDRNVFDGRSPGYQESRQYGDYRKSPARAEVVNDWRREDRFGNGRKTEDTRSPDRQRDVDISSPPMARPVREILGENVSPLRIEPPKDNGTGRTQRSVSSSSLASSNGNPPEMKNENLGSLIDFDAFADPPPPQTQQVVPDKSTEQLSTSSNADNWACFDSVPSTIVSSAPSNANAFDSVLSQLSAPTSDNIAALPTATPPMQMSASNFGSNFQAISSPANNLTMFPPAHYPLAASGAGPSNNFAPFPNTVNSHVTVSGAGQWSGMPFEQRSSFPAAGNQPAGQSLFAPPVGGSQNNQSWNSFNVPTTLASSSVSGSLPTSVTVPAAAPAQSTTSEPKSASRNELPQDLFTSTYPSYGAMPGWQTAMHPGFGHQMQYNTAMHMAQSQVSKSSNPFDLNDGAPSHQVSAFPAMGSLQGALPNLAAPSSLLHTSNTGPPLPMWAPQSSYPSSVPQAQSYFPTMPSNALMAQSVHNNMPNMPMSGRPQGGVMGFGMEGGGGSAFVSSNPGQEHQIYSPPTAANPFPNMGGNPFG
ncbi:probable ADP-ribosylation factor GTPase-activating protein AGD14 [Impatiens glandulifera]|uniref:probable ADP-ribosylation factor GTPase-activating protein AGD14 n=1 Tax=Impatiens glandulifera TaxID=253017 RepID=UPI001FB053AA|nr:probable ADP-ribosylation factor GTPase-activating protein AGD14 [Impatiens glandulifera]